MAKRYDAVIFDVDGTLLDTTEGVLNSVKYAMQEKNLEIPSDECLRSFIGPPIQNSFAKLYGIEGEDLQELADLFRDRYKSTELLKAKPYEGLFEVLDNLKNAGIKIGVATYKREDYAITLLKHFGFDKYTDVMHGADNNNVLKKRDIIELCLKEMGVKDYKRAVMIGDSDNDAIGADHIGIEFVGVTYGFDFSKPEDVRKFPSVGCVNKPIDLLSILI